MLEKIIEASEKRECPHCKSEDCIPLDGWIDGTVRFECGKCEKIYFIKIDVYNNNENWKWVCDRVDAWWTRQEERNRDWRSIYNNKFDKCFAELKKRKQSIENFTSMVTYRDEQIRNKDKQIKEQIFVITEKTNEVNKLRNTIDEIIETFECDTCGKKKIRFLDNFCPSCGTRLKWEQDENLNMDK